MLLRIVSWAMFAFGAVFSVFVLLWLQWWLLTILLGVPITGPVNTWWTITTILVAVVVPAAVVLRVRRAQAARRQQEGLDRMA